MIQMIPLHPRKITSKQLKSGLKEQGHDVSLRTIQRDLRKLIDSGNFSIKETEPEGRGKENLAYCFEASAKSLGPRLDQATALSLLLAADYIKRMLPDQVFNALIPTLNQAESSLDETKGRKHASWQDKVRSVPRYLTFLKPVVQPEIHEAVTKALMEETDLEIKYLDQPQHRRLSPLALVDRGLETILLAWDHSVNDYRQFMLHRLSEAQTITWKRRVPQGYNLDEMVSTGYFSVPLSRKPQPPINLHLKLWRRKDTAKPWLDLAGTPLSEDQQIKIDEDNQTAELKARVNDTWELRGWLLSLGTQVEVIAPKKLRNFMQQSATELHGRYARSR
jgi:predicted DNA-binding transcriptional regulator YafY